MFSKSRRLVEVSYRSIHLSRQNWLIVFETPLQHPQAESSRFKPPASPRPQLKHPRTSRQDQGPSSRTRTICMLPRNRTRGGCEESRRAASLRGIKIRKDGAGTLRGSHESTWTGRYCGGRTRRTVQMVLCKWCRRIRVRQIGLTVGCSLGAPMLNRRLYPCYRIAIG